MSESKRTSDVLVGVTVIVVTALLLATVLWVKQSDFGGTKTGVIVRAREVGGVALGNPVVIRGVRAGQVTSIALGEKGWVVLQLAVDNAIPLPSDPVVLLVASSLFGEWQVTITESTGVPPDRALRAALAEARTSGDTLAGAVLPDIAQLTSVAGRIAGDVALVADRVQVAFDDKAARELRESIHSFAQLSSELAKTVSAQSKNLERISSDVQDGLTTVNAAAATLTRFSNRVDSATNGGELRSIVVHSQDAAKELVSAATRLRELSQGLTRTEAQLATAVSRADSVFNKANNGQGSLGLMLNDASLYRNSDSLVRDLRALVADVKRNPRRYLNVRVF